MVRQSLRRWFRNLRGPTLSVREIRFISIACLCIGPAVLFVMLAAGAGGRTATGTVKLGGDFPQFYVAASILQEPGPPALYDLRLQERRFREIRPAEAELRLPFIYPPWVALLFSPLAGLPYAWAYAAWSAASLALYLAGIMVLLRWFRPDAGNDRATMVLMALSFEPFLFETLIGGQVTSIGFFALAAAIDCDVRRRPFLSGLFLSLCLYKPNLLTLIVPMLVCSCRWRALGGLAAGGSLVTAVTALVAGPSVLTDYAAVARYFTRLYMSSTDVLRAWKYVDLRSATTLLTGSPSIGLLFLVICTCLVGPVLVLRWRRDARSAAREPGLVWAVTIAWTLLLNVYVPFYDCTLAVLPLLLLTHAIGGTPQLHRFPHLQWLVVLVYVGAWFSQAIAQISGLQVYTLLLLALSVFAVTLSPQDRRGLLQHEHGRDGSGAKA
jgi:hypothetical protein